MTKMSNENAIKVSESDKTKSGYGKKSIVNTYEDKLNYNKGQPLLWNSWVQPRPSITSETENLTPTFLLSTREEKPPSRKELEMNMGATKFRDVRCCKCSCIGNVHLVEKTEEIIDVLRNCCYECSAHLLNSLPYMKKKKHFSSSDHSFNFESKDFVAKNCFGEAVTTDTPPYQRKHFCSLSEGPAYHNQRPIQRLSHHKTVSSPQEITSSCYRRATDNKKSNSKQNLASESSKISSEDVKSNDQLLNSSFATKPFNFSDENNIDSIGGVNKRFTGALAIKKGLSVSNQLVYSYHRSLLAAGNMKQHAGKKPVRVHLLNGESILLVFDPKALVKEVFEQVCSMHAINESHFFGLSAIIENEHRFMDLKQKLSKYAPKEWGKETRRRGSDLSIQPSSIFTVQFQVQYYLEHPKLICNEESRHHYYLQLKKNVLQSKVPVQDELLFTLAAIALHLDLGPFDPSSHKGHYFDPHDYVPAWFLKKWNEDYLWMHLPTMHEELITTSSFQALADYIQQASTVEDVPIHYYKLFKTKRETEPSVIMGIFHQGIRIHHISQQRWDGPHLLDFEFPWNKVGRLFFAGKRFEIYPDDQPASRKLVYFTGSKSRSKYLLRLLRDTHSLYMSLSPFVDHMRKVDGKKNRRKYRESYISGQNLEEKMGKDGERLVGSFKSKQNNCLFTYQSSLSNGSSRTSGIGSDVRHGINDVIEDEDDDAFVKEIESSKVLKPSSDSSSTTKIEHVVALSSHSGDEKSLAKAAHNQNSTPSELSGQKRVVLVEVANSEQKSSSPDLSREESAKSDKVLLDTQTMSSRTATLKKNSSMKKNAESSGEITDARAVSGAESSLPPKASLEDTLTSILHDSNLAPPSPDEVDSPLPGKDVIPESNEQHVLSGPLKDEPDAARKTQENGLHHSSHQHKSVLESSAVLRTFSNDSGMQKGHERNSREKRNKPSHKRNKSVHDANSSASGTPSGKHFGAPLTTKQNLEDLTVADSSQSNLTGPIKLDIAKALRVGHYEPTHAGSAPVTPNHVSQLIKGPIVGVSWHRYNGTEVDEKNRQNRRRSDISGMYSPELNSNGFHQSSAGHTPGKPNLLYKHHKKLSRPLSYQVYSEPELQSNTGSGSCKSTPTKLHAPIFIESFKEVIV